MPTDDADIANDEVNKSNSLQVNIVTIESTCLVVL